MGGGVKDGRMRVVFSAAENSHIFHTIAVLFRKLLTPRPDKAQPIILLCAQSIYVTLDVRVHTYLRRTFDLKNIYFIYSFHFHKTEVSFKENLK